MTRKIIAVATLLMSTAVCAQQGTFKSIDAALATLPGARAMELKDNGQLDQTGSLFHAQLIAIKRPDAPRADDAQQIILFREYPPGEFRILDQSKLMSYMGGSGNWRVSSIKFSNSNLYVSMAYTWRDCSGSSRSQFRLDSDHLLMIGNESLESNLKTGKTVTSSSNLLNGRGNWVLETEGRKKMYQAHEPFGAILFSAFDGEGWISPYHKENRIC